MDAQILGVLRLMDSVSTADVVFYERVSIYLEDYHLFYFSVLHFGNTTLEIE